MHVDIYVHTYAYIHMSHTHAKLNIFVYIKLEKCEAKYNNSRWTKYFCNMKHSNFISVFKIY